MQCNETTVKISGMTVEKKFFELNLNIVCKKVTNHMPLLLHLLIIFLRENLK